VPISTRYTHTHRTGVSVMLSEYPLRVRVRTSGVIYLHSSSPLERDLIGFKPLL